MLRNIIYFCCLFITSCTCQMTTPEMLKSFVQQTLREMERDLNKTDRIRQNSLRTPAYEIGFVMRTMEECYRRMVDIYNSSLTTDLYNLDAHTTDHIMFLKHVENYHWIVDHLGNMLHEIEKKYQIKTAGMFEKHREIMPSPRPSTTPHRFRSRAVLSMTTPTKRPKQTWWRLDYGWDEMKDEWR